MPKVILSPARRAEQRVNGWILLQMKIQKKTQADIGEIIGLPAMCVCRRLSCETPWKFEELYDVVTELGGRLEEIL